MNEEAFRARMYSAYSDFDFYDGCAEELMFRRDIAPHLPPDTTLPVMDIGCGQGHVVELLLRAGYANASGVDVSPSQVREAHAAGRFAVVEGDFKAHLAAHPNNFGAIIATDFLEHLTKMEVLEALDAAYAALRPGGCFIARTPNSVSPFAGNYQHGDFTHLTAFTAGGLRQVTLAAGFSRFAAYPCDPIAHGGKSALRKAAWRAISGVLKASLAAETGRHTGHIVTQNLVGVARKGSP